MDLTSVQVHWIGGALFTVVASLLLLRNLVGSTARFWDYLLPLLFIGYGLESFIDIWVHGHAVPEGYADESRQHLWQGAALLVAGMVELLLVRGALTHRSWRLATPLALVALAVGFLFHAHHGASEVSMALMITEHRGFAIALLVAAGARAVSILPTRGAQSIDSGWLLPLLVFGLQMLTYRESMPAIGLAHDDHVVRQCPFSARSSADSVPVAGGVLHPVYWTLPRWEASQFGYLIPPDP